MAINKGLPSLGDIQNLLHVADKKEKCKKLKKCTSKKVKKSKRRKESSSYSSDSSSSSSESESDSSSEETSDMEETPVKKQKRGKKLKSGLHEKNGNAKLVTGKCFAHAALDDELGGERELRSLSINLLFTGELEIITHPRIGVKEKETRLEVLKKLAYKAEYLSREDIIKQYANFIQKIERGKFKWGSKSSLCVFEQQLVYNISVDSCKAKCTQKVKNKFNDRKKYCLDYNRGQCKFDKSHDGLINGQNFFKLHMCKQCLVNEGIEVTHPEKECPKRKCLRDCELNSELQQFANFYIEANRVVRASGAHNFEKARIRLPSNFNFEFLEKELKGFKYQIVIDLLKFGFPLGMTRDCGSSEIPPNHKGATEFPGEIKQMLNKEVKSFVAIGPFDRVPLQGAKFSPLNSVPKKDSTQRRMILDLSFPEGNSINEGINKDLYFGMEEKLVLPSIDALADRVMELGPGCKLFKIDLSHSYH